MKVAALEAFYSGSHKRWLDEWIQHSSHHITAFTLPGRHWKWRSYGGAISLAQQLNDTTDTFEAIVTTDITDVALFKSLLKPSLQSLPIVLYMHENQLTYPWSPTDQDVSLQRDRHYGFKNFTSCLVSDLVIFNSAYHKASFLDALPPFLAAFPDEQPLSAIETIAAKSIVVPVGIGKKDWQLKTMPKKPVLLWNHRWEYDKNPDDFLAFLRRLSENQLEFELLVLGEKALKWPKTFERIHEEFAPQIKQFGNVDNVQEYHQLISQSHFLPVFSKQDFFGISVVEAMAVGVIPLLPNRLAYPEHIPDMLKPLLLHQGVEDALSKFQSVFQICQDAEKYCTLQLSVHSAIEPYLWEHCITRLDESVGEAVKTKT